MGKSTLWFVILFVFLITACDNADETPTPTDTPPPTETSEPTATPEPTEISDTEDDETESESSETQSQGTIDLLSYSVADCEYGGLLRSVEAIDRLTVRFTLCDTDPAFPSKVAFTAMGIYPSEFLEQAEGEELFRSPISTGPYILEEWDEGNEIILTRFDDYWGEPALEETLIFRWNTDAEDRVRQLEAGEADGIDNPAPNGFQTIIENDDLALYERAGANIFYVGLNEYFEPLNEKAVRQAIAHAIDKEAIVEQFFPPGSQVAGQFMPPSIFGYTEEVEPFEYNLDRAKELLDEAGLVADDDGNRFEVTLYYRDVARPYLPLPADVAINIQEQLEEIGIQVTVEVMESGPFLDAADAGELSMFLLGWNADYPDATNFLDYHFGVGASEQFGETHSEIGDTLMKAAQLADIEERYPLYVEANTYLRDLAPMIPVAYGGSGVAFQADIEGAHSSPLAIEYFAVMEDPDDDDLIWIQNGEPAGIYCADETDGEALRVCVQITEALLGYEVGGTTVIPRLATEWEVNEDLTEWTFTLRDNVKFHDGTDFDANDVVVSYSAQWDISNPLHTGRDGNFTYFNAFFNEFMDSGN